MTDDEAINEVTCNGAFNSSWIAVKGTPDNKQVAEMIGRDYNAKVAVGETGAFIGANSGIEKAFCFDEEGLEAVCEDMSSRLPFRITPDNFEF